MHRRVVGSFALLSLAAAGCIVPEKATPAVGFGTTFATRFVHRGMTLVDNPVVQPELAVRLPTTWDQSISLRAEGSIELRNDTGGAWFPDGHAGRFTQIEFQGAYRHQLGPVSLTGGVHSYNLPNGLEFQNGERGGTTEVFGVASTEVLEATPYVSIHYDFDEVRGAYYRAGLQEEIPLGEKLALRLDGSIGYVSEAQSSWMYGFDQAGIADLRGEIVLAYQYDARTSLRAGAHASAIMDDDIDEWFSLLGIDDDPIWFTASVVWTF